MMIFNAGSAGGVTKGFEHNNPLPGLKSLRRRCPCCQAAAGCHIFFKKPRALGWMRGTNLKMQNSFKTDQWLRHLRRGAEKLGIELDDGKTALLEVFAKELLAANERLNLTRVLDPVALADKLILDSVYPGKFLEGEGRVLDLGTGGGVPGVPLKIARPEMELTLIDGKRKKINFVKYVIRKLGLEGIEARQVRADALAGEGVRFGCVITRAVASLADLLRMAFPVLAPGGVMVAMKGAHYQEEIEAFRETGKIVCGGRLVDPAALDIGVERYQLPLSGLERALIFIRERGQDI